MIKSLAIKKHWKEVRRIIPQEEEAEILDEPKGDIVHLGRGKRPYRVERGEHGEFKSIKGPVETENDKK